MRTGTAIRAFASSTGRLPTVYPSPCGQSHAGGDKLFVDYAGDTVPVIVDRLTGAKRPAQIFVAVLGASSFSYAEATWTQTLPDWIAAHTRALAAIGGAPKLLVPDNAKVAIVKACRYDPQVNRTYSEMAAHYGAAVLPARPRKPRDKAKVEVCVLIVERWLLGCLRHRQFYSLGELNQAIFEMLAEINERRPLRRLGVTRRQLFEELDRPALWALPVEPYVYAEWRLRRAGLDYHVDVEGHYYSVPYRFAREELEVRLDGWRGRGFQEGRTHLRALAKFRATTSIRRVQIICRPATAALRTGTIERIPPGGVRAWRLHRDPLRPHPREPAPSRAGLQGVPWHRQACKGLRPRARRGGVPKGA